MEIEKEKLPPQPNMKQAILSCLSDCQSIHNKAFLIYTPDTIYTHFVSRYAIDEISSKNVSNELTFTLRNDIECHKEQGYKAFMMRTDGTLAMIFEGNSSELSQGWIDEKWADKDTEELTYLYNWYHWNKNKGKKPKWR